jgi:hypothetical protein
MRSRTGHPLGSCPAAYAELLAQLARAGWVCRGTVVCRTLRRKGRNGWPQWRTRWLEGAALTARICAAVPRLHCRLMPIRNPQSAIRNRQLAIGRQRWEQANV